MRRFEDEQEERAAAQSSKETHLDSFIRFCQCEARDTDPDSAWQSLTFAQFPQKYVFSDPKKEWTRDTANKTHMRLGRMYPIHPSAGEVYYLRLLLCNMTGEDVRSTGRTGHGRGVYSLKGTHDTFKEACTARGLLQDDGEWRSAMREARRTAMPRQLRALFLHIICYCGPENIGDLFDEFYMDMGEDFARVLTEKGLQDTDANIYCCVLIALRGALDPVAMKEVLQQLPDKSDREWMILHILGERENETLSHVYQYDQDSCSNTFQTFHKACNKAQKGIVDEVILQTMSNEQTLLFVDAPGGCGKTFTFNCLINYYHSQGMAVLVVATTGIAALQLQGGKTVHSSLKIPINTTGVEQGDMQLPITADSQLGQLIINDLCAVIWDEAPMIHKDIFESVNRCFQFLRRNDNPFGGVSIILGGDFRQCLPIVQHGSREDQVAASIRSDPVFRSFAHAQLHENMRVADILDKDPERGAELLLWSSTLLKIGNGKYLVSEDDPTDDADDDMPNEFLTNVPDIIQVKTIKTSNDIDDMIHMAFGDMSTFDTTIDPMEAYQTRLNTSILCPKHVSVDYINARCLQKMAGESIVCHSIDEYVNGSDAMVVPLEQLNGKTPSGSPPARLELKKGAVVVMLRNMADGLMNGSRLEVLGMKGPYCLHCRVLTGTTAGREVYLPRFKFVHEGVDQPLKWSRRQFPVKLAWAMTINVKSRVNKYI